MTTQQVKQRANQDEQTQKNQIPSPELAFSEEIARDTDYATDGSIIYRWNGNIWRPIEPMDAERDAFRWLGKHPNYFTKATPKLAASCACAAMINARRLPVHNNPAHVVLPVKNGYLHINASGTLSLQPPEKRFGLAYMIDCDFDPAAKAPEFAQFLESVLPDQAVRSWVQAYVGYTLMADTRFQKATFWLGAGANGKSTLAEICAALHAKTSAMTLDCLDGFKLVSLIGTSLVFVDETPNRIDEQRLKALISGGLVQIDRKFREPLSLRPTAKWIICGNALPAISDQSHGFWRRMPVVVFEKQFAEHEQDPLLARRIISSEMAGVLAWAVAGLEAVLQNGKLPETPVAMLRAIDDGKRETNSVLAWFDDDRIEQCDSAWTDRAEVFRDYKAWALERSFCPVNETKFWSRVKMIDPAAAFPTRKKIEGKMRRGVAVKLLDQKAW